MQAGIQLSVPLVLIVLLMALRARGAVKTATSPGRTTGGGSGTTLVLGGLSVVGLATLGSDWRQGITLSSIFAVIALSIVVLTGYVGQISLAPMAFAGIAAFAMVKLTGWGLPFPVAPLAAGFAAVVVGLLVGIPAVRVRGMNLAIVTLAAAVVVEELVLGWSWFTGGGVGAEVPPPELFGVDLGIAATGADFPRRLRDRVRGRGGGARRRRAHTYDGATPGWSPRRARERAGGGRRRHRRRPDQAGRVRPVGPPRAELGRCSPPLLPRTRSPVSILALLAMTYLAGIASIGGALLAGALAQGSLLGARWVRART
ncbi:MAG: branched-chain amino acid ABC transporter permease, partial [Acidimicrobiia bacterium]|nr:branched-chain amino acid ABC transporter permease [Acidimicrobiia bacterium]